MKKTNLFIFDTNTLISASLIKNSVNERALNAVFRSGYLAFSEQTFTEFVDVLYRPKFDKYLTEERRLQMIARMEQYGERFTPTETFSSAVTRKIICSWSWPRWPSLLVL